MSGPGFTADATLYRSRGYGRAGVWSARGGVNAVIPAFWKELCRAGCWAAGGAMGAGCATGTAGAGATACAMAAGALASACSDSC